MIVDEKPQLKENDGTQLVEEKEETQLEVNEKTRLSRRTLIISLAALVIGLVLATTTVYFAALNFNCPWRIDSCSATVREYKQNNWPWSPCLPCPFNRQ